MESYAPTRCQDGRATNEDAYVIGRGEVPYAALCDGSGNAQGVAKRALGIFQRLMTEARADEVSQFATWSNWTQLLDSALMGGPQSTFVAVSVVGSQAFGACAGDSRLYRLATEGGIEVVTEEASKYRLCSGKAAPYPIHLPLKAGELLLLASDGAWTPLGLPALQRAWGQSASRHFSEFPTLLLEEAGKNGCADDMTVIAIRQG